MACDRATTMEFQRNYEYHKKFEKLDKKLARELRFLNWQQKKFCGKIYKQPIHLKNSNNFQIIQNIDSILQTNKTRPQMTKYQVSNHFLQEVPCINKELEKTDASLIDKIKKIQEDFKNGVMNKFDNKRFKYIDDMREETLHAQFYDQSLYNKMKIIKNDFKNRGLKFEKEFSPKQIKNSDNTAIKDNLASKENRIKYDVKVHETDLDKHVKLFQRLLRGRAYQTMIILAKVRYIPYLQSEKSTVTQAVVDSASVDFGNNENEDNLLEFSTRRYISRFFNILSTESVRNYEASKNAAIAKFENATRIMKEAYEGNKRQLEQKRREEQEEILKQVLKIHQDLSELFSEEFINEAIEECAKEEGLKLIDEITTKKPFNKNKFYNNDNKNIEKELVWNSIIPEAYNIIHRDNTN